MALRDRVVLTLAFVLAAPISLAHVDFAGDVHPVVVVQGDRFLVFFKNNRSRTKWLSVYDKTGRVQTARSPAPYLPAPRAHVETPRAKGMAVPHADRWWIIEDHQWIHRGHPAAVELHNQQVQRHALSWPEAVATVHDAFVSDNDLVLLVTHRSRRCYLYRFSKANLRAKPERTPLKDVSFKSYFPTTTDILRHGKRYLLAWVDTASQLILFSWEPGGTGKETQLARVASTNTTVSMATIDRQLLLAYHAPSDAPKAGSTIRVLIRQLPPP
jgi:hypothetical protein